MVHLDTHGRGLKVGDRVFIPAVVIGVSDKDTDQHNTIVHTEESNGISVLRFPVNSKQVILRDEKTGEPLGQLPPAPATAEPAIMEEK